MALQTSDFNNSSWVWHLLESELFQGIQTASLRRLLPFLHHRIYDRDEPIFCQGEEAASLYVLNRGVVQLSTLDSDGRERILGFLKSGEVFGEDVLGNVELSSTQALAHEESWVTVISRSNLQSMIDRHPRLAMNLLRQTSARLAEALNQLRVATFLDSERRVAATLLKLGRGHGSQVFSEPEKVRLRIRLSHRQLAALVGGNRPHVSTILSRFRNRGWLESRNRRFLFNRETLEEFVGQERLGMVERSAQPMDGSSETATA